MGMDALIIQADKKAFKYFTKGSFYTKSHILNKLEEIPLANAYLPDETKRNFFTRNFLIRVIN